MLMLQKHYVVQEQALRWHKRKLLTVPRGGVYVTLLGGPCATVSQWVSNLTDILQMRLPILPNAERPAIWYTYKRSENPYVYNYVASGQRAPVSAGS